MEGFELLKRVKKQPRFIDLPVLIYTSKDLSRREETQLKRYAAAIITKTNGSAERLLEETSLFLHRVLKSPNGSEAADSIQTEITDADAAPTGTASANQAPATPISTETAASKRPASKRTTRKNKTKPQTKTAALKDKTVGEIVSPVDFAGQTVLVVDDDMRNIFALTSVLESQGVNVLFAENGRDGIEKLQQNEAISLVLMDVMMPEMDGYETMRAIRELEGYSRLPIIALTAKALSGDREKCLEAGASDYITKPVDVNVLLNMMSRLLAASSD
jgi:CheY-like chemotaxis protein